MDRRVAVLLRQFLLRLLHRVVVEILLRLPRKIATESIYLCRLCVHANGQAMDWCACDIVDIVTDGTERLIGPCPFKYIRAIDLWGAASL